MYYLYQHVRNDTGNVFYVGIGDKYRPNEKSSRNKFWNNIVLKTEYSIEIIRSFYSWEEACEWEMFFISIYGRRVDGTGPLVNLTYGGDGTSGFKQSIESIEKRRDSMISKKSYAVDAYALDGRRFIGSYINLSSAASCLNVNRGSVYACIHKEQYHTKGYTFCHYRESPEWDQIESSIITGKSIRGSKKFLLKFSKPVIQYSLEGEFINEYQSASEASRFLGKSGSNIANCANNKPGHLTAYGFKWKWKQ